MARVAASRVAVILAEAASVEEAAAQGSRSVSHVAPKAFHATYHLVILRLFYSDAFYTLYFSEKKRSRVKEAIFMAKEKALVGIIMGSESDMPNMEPCMKQLEEFGIPYEVKVASAHRKPAEVHEWASGAEERGMRVIVAAAGKAAHLGGVVAAYTPLPVIAVPMKTSDLGGLDSLLSMVQMPSGVPVACVAINGAKNAAILAVQMLGTGCDECRKKISDFKAKMAE